VVSGGFKAFEDEMGRVVGGFVCWKLTDCAAEDGLERDGVG